MVRQDRGLGWHLGDIAGSTRPCWPKLPDPRGLIPRGLALLFGPFSCAATPPADEECPCHCPSPSTTARGTTLGLGALERVLPRCARRRARPASARLGLPVR